MGRLMESVTQVAADDKEVWGTEVGRDVERSLYDYTAGGDEEG